MLLIVGGRKDHNIARLADAADHRRHPYKIVHTDSGLSVAWDMARAADIVINGETFNARNASLFIRYDVFGSGGDSKNADAWYDALKGWALADQRIGLLNRRNENLGVNKPRALIWARQAGFAVPATVITNDFNLFADKNRYIAKPVEGGAHTQLLDECEDNSRPWIVQEKLDYPELRVFRAGPHYFGFEINGTTLDCRADNNMRINEAPVPPDLRDSMEKLTGRMGLDFAAADFKTCPVTGKKLFLEINTMPMFTGYDLVAEGRLSDAMILTLRGLERGAAPRKSPSPKP